MSESKFCGVGNLSVVIPYRDLERLLKLARNMDSFEASLSQMDRKMTGLHGLYADLLEKVREIEKSL